VNRSLIRRYFISRLLHTTSTFWRALAAARLNPNAKCSGATELPGDVFTAHHTRYFTADLVLEHRPPQDQAETEPVVDHGKSAAGQLRRTQKLSTYGLPLLNRREGKTPLGGELAAGPLSLPAAKGSR
jgi:hypothetical protein